MKIKQAVGERIIELCRERNLAINALANNAGVPASTLKSIVNKGSDNPGIKTIKKICDGFEITITEFFDTSVFRLLEQEIE